MTYVNFDEAGARRAATADPVGFVAGVERPVEIDEVQRAPEILLEIKRVVGQRLTTRAVPSDRLRQGALAAPRRGRSGRPGRDDHAHGRLAQAEVEG